MIHRRPSSNMQASIGEPCMHIGLSLKLVQYHAYFTLDLVERNNSIGFLREDEFIGLTNFTMKFIRKITHENEPDFNGFIVRVKTQPLAGTGQVHSG